MDLVVVPSREQDRVDSDRPGLSNSFLGAVATSPFWRRATSKKRHWERLWFRRQLILWHALIFCIIGAHSIFLNCNLLARRPYTTVRGWFLISIPWIATWNPTLTRTPSTVFFALSLSVMVPFPRHSCISCMGCCRDLPHVSIVSCWNDIPRITSLMWFCPRTSCSWRRCLGGCDFGSLLFKSGTGFGKNLGLGCLLLSRGHI